MMIHIDGSLGEGGGQILRSGLALSMVTGRPLRIEKIRAGRDKPGLLRQHLTAVNAAAEISGATIEGAAIGSQQLAFMPREIRPGDHTFAIGTAGSTTLVLQSVLPALLCAHGASTLTLEGGTHNPHAPPLDFLEKAFLPLINRMGPAVHVTLDRAGFYPAGGGRFHVKIQPVKRLVPLHLTERGEIRRRTCTVALAALPDEIADRELAVVRKAMDWPDDSFQVRHLPADQGPGNILTIEIESEQVTEVFTGFGTKGVRAEAVAEHALQETKRYLAAGVPVGRCLADQLLLPLALAGGGSFLTQPLTRHSTTNIEIIRSFLDIPITVRQVGRERHLVDVGA
jgi:RNA 3'-terminal phosphate cyclase (ATP)